MPGSGVPNTWWLFQYRSVGSVNGFNEFVDSQTCGVVPLSVPTEKGVFNRVLYADTGIALLPASADNASGTPLEPCEIEFSFLDVPSAWAVQQDGSANWDAAPGSPGYGFGSGIPSDTGFLSFLQTLSRDCGMCSGNGAACVADAQCPTGTCVGGDNDGGDCHSNADCPPDGTCDGGELCIPNAVAQTVSLNTNTGNPDENTIFDTVAAWVPVTIIGNRGTGIQDVKFSELQYHFVTGRMPNGENLTAATRDVGSGTRNAAMNSLGIDTSWGRGDNIGDQATTAADTNLGVGTQPTNCGGSSIEENSVEMRRLAIGYTGLGGGSRAAADAQAGKYEILDTCKDVGPAPCDCEASGYVRAGVDKVLDNCDPCTSFQIAGSGSFVLRGNSNANRDPGTDPQWEDSIPLDNQAVADYLNNIMDSSASFAGSVFEDECDKTRGCSAKRCGGTPAGAVCTTNGQCTAPDTCDFVQCLTVAQCAGGETCDLLTCNNDGDCFGKVCSVSRDPCLTNADCPGGETCTADDFCKVKLNMPGDLLATEFFLPSGLDCIHVLTDPLAYVPVNTNTVLQQFIRANSVIDVPAYGSVNTAGRVPKRNSLLVRGDAYSDGSASGSYVYWNGSNFVTVASGLRLSARNRIQGDFNEDFARNMTDIEQLVRAYYTPRAWQQTPVANGTASCPGNTACGDMNRDNAIPEVLGDFDGNGNFNKEDLRYFADGLAMMAGQLNRKQGHIMVDTWIQNLGRPFPWADGAEQLLVPPAATGQEPTFVAPVDVNDPVAPFLKTKKAYALGDFRGDVAGALARMGGPPTGWDGVVDDQDINYVCANIGDWFDLDQAALIDLSCDMNGDLQVSYADVEELVGQVLGSGIGDVNLDGIVDEVDEAILNATIGDPESCNATGTCGWADGDLNCDGVADEADMSALCMAYFADLDDDCDVDADDYRLLQQGLTGPSEEGCTGAGPNGDVVGDLDGDCDVDLADFSILQARFTGSN